MMLIWVCMQEPDDIMAHSQLLRLRHKLASILAAAVHHGYLSVQEGICNVLDVSGQIRGFGTEEQPTLFTAEDQAQWPSIIAEQYMNPGSPGK